MSATQQAVLTRMPTPSDHMRVVEPDARLQNKVKFLGALNLKNSGSSIRTRVSGMTSSVSAWVRSTNDKYRESTLRQGVNAGTITAAAFIGFDNVVKATVAVTGLVLKVVKKVVNITADLVGSAAFGISRIIGKFNKKAGQKMSDALCDATDWRVRKIDSISEKITKFGRAIVERTSHTLSGAIGWSVGARLALYWSSATKELAAKAAANPKVINRILAKTSASTIYSLVAMLVIAFVMLGVTQAASAVKNNITAKKTIAADVADVTIPEQTSKPKSAAPKAEPKKNAPKPATPADIVATPVVTDSGVVVAVEGAENVEQAQVAANEQMEKVLKKLERTSLQHGPRSRGKRRR